MKTFFITCLLGFFALSGKLYAQERVAQRVPQQAQERESQQEQEWQVHREQRRQMQAFEVRTREGREFTRELWEQKNNLFTERLELTPEESEKFWCLYMRYMAERDRLTAEINRKTRIRQAPGERPVFDVSNLSDAEVQQLVDYRAKQIDLQRQFHNDLTQLFSPRRVLAFYDAERSFQRELINAGNRRGSVTVIDARRGRGVRDRSTSTE